MIYGSLDSTREIKNMKKKNKQTRLYNLWSPYERNGINVS
jgi:hypothetical protein